ncbi:uncharacterized protein LOC116186968 [Punica granatum]|uniref:Uncharacterized protein LOC116186968 n=2 Tax=Punica granatum TaxID=22663 RepID=A0A6P8BN58_PUNGR|nr:uncharacterized protein LOC116186968 [Punica granatum]XP_031371400.1 uncharacterized protein LOC116186968 [Punica granatum]XP_031371407.1 uncharacterized protein LOC116186968 [Punica granatum]XP_031371415.1 uncharacterized protein LOC116186968 [Punica granatum]XP_031371424.1 uncharacterized protein LOC116186968 [Punica granatum]PKI73112.1 hypothetical protein CRG98_006520 [Punica granatum]
MAVVFTPLSWWVSSGKQKEPRIPNGPPVNPSPSETGSWESDTLKFPLWKRNVASSSRNIKRKWRSREERKIDREYDIVLVPPDGGCISGSESDDSDWSIGWLEPHGPGFRSDDESEDSFAVLVPCYGRDRDDLEDDRKSKLLGIVGNIADIYPADGNNYMEQWLSSLQNS